MRSKKPNTRVSIILTTVIHLGWQDRFRVLFGSTIQTTTWGIEEKVDKPDVLEALREVSSITFIAPLFRRRSRGMSVGGEHIPPDSR